MGYEGGMHEIRDKDARDSGQLLHFGDFFCIFALSFIKNGKWEINHLKTEGKTTGVHTCPISF